MIPYFRTGLHMTSRHTWFGWPMVGGPVVKLQRSMPAAWCIVGAPISTRRLCCDRCKRAVASSFDCLSCGLGWLCWLGANLPGTCRRTHEYLDSLFSHSAHFCVDGVCWHAQSTVLGKSSQATQRLTTLYTCIIERSNCILHECTVSTSAPEQGGIFRIMTAKPS